MDPITTALFNLGAGGVIAGVMYAVLLQVLKDFKEEQAALREQHDRHMGRLVDKIDALAQSVYEGRCRAEGGPK